MPKIPFPVLEIRLQHELQSHRTCSWIANIRYFAEEHRAGLFGIAAPTDDVERVTGRPPEDFDVTARRYLENPGLVHQRFKTGTTLGAIRMLLKTMLTPAANTHALDRNFHAPLLSHGELAHEGQDWHEGITRFESANTGNLFSRLDVAAVTGEKENAASMTLRS